MPLQKCSIPSLFLIGALALIGPQSSYASTSPIPSEVRASNGLLTVDGQPFPVRGIHYGPWRPRTGPNKQYAYPSLADIEQDFRLITDAHANTVLIYDAPPEVLDLAERYGLKVIYCFALDWNSVGGETQPAIRAHLVERVRALKDKPALLAWLLGNEVGSEILQRRGDSVIVGGIHDLYDAVKAADPHHPVSHANWPPARRLELGFLDFASFNVYPLWPPEVVAMGYGPYLRTVLKPIAGNRPLLITEFGVNTTEAGEAGQVRLLRESWHGIVQTGTAGGVVFEFADEWWKNYDNPVRAGDWWSRNPAPDDELTHDDDPEENYGLVTAERKPKPAFAVIAELYGESSRQEVARASGAVIVGAMVVLAVVGFLWARRRQARRLVRTA